MREIRELCRGLGMFDEAVADACALYEQVPKRLRYRRAVIPAVVALASKLRGDPVSLARIAKVSTDVLKTHPRAVLRSYWRLMRLLHVQVRLVDASVMIDHVARRLPVLSSQIFDDAKAIVAKYMACGRHAGKNVWAVAAAAVYMAAVKNGSFVSQRCVAKAFYVSEGAVRARLREMSDRCGGGAE